MMKETARTFPSDKQSDGSAGVWLVVSILSSALYLGNCPQASLPAKILKTYCTTSSPKDLEVVHSVTSGAAAVFLPELEPQPVSSTHARGWRRRKAPKVPPRQRRHQTQQTATPLASIPTYDISSPEARNSAKTISKK